MPTAQGPAGPRRRLGAQLRELRRNARLPLAAVAQELDCSTSKISRLETGKGIPRMPDVVALLRVYEVTDEALRTQVTRLVQESREEGWWEPYTDGVQTERFVMRAPKYTALETEAVRVRSFEVAWVHGLLQIPAYTRAVLDALLSEERPAGEMDRLVELRQLRQQLLTDRTPPLQLELVLDESVLGREVGSSEIMAAQLAALEERSRLPNVIVRVLPFAAGLHRAHAGSFQILEFPEHLGADVVFVEGPAGDTFENPSEVTLYKGVLGDVASRALDPTASRELIRAHFERHISAG